MYSINQQKICRKDSYANLSDKIKTKDKRQKTKDKSKK